MSTGVGVDDYALVRVPQEARYSWWSVAVQRFGQVSALSQFLLGVAAEKPTRRTRRGRPRAACEARLPSAERRHFPS